MVIRCLLILVWRHSKAEILNTLWTLPPLHTQLNDVHKEETHFLSAHPRLGASPRALLITRLSLLLRKPR